MNNYTKCPICLAHYPDDPEYVHTCDGLMKMLGMFKKKTDFEKIKELNNKIQSK